MTSGFEVDRTALTNQALRRLSLALLAATLLTLGPIGCAGAKPREHWWQFWRPRGVPSASIYHPDRLLLPPPPNLLAPASADESLAPPDPLGELMLRPVTPPPRVEPSGPVADLQTVHFAFDSDALNDEAQAILDENLRWILDRPDIQIQIEGHCDERGTNEYNFSLGERRAKRVWAYLIDKGAPEERLHFISYGEERPLDPGKTEAAYALNRRAQFLVY
jgi:peptidoglycan-associated lipoprotein